MIEPVPVTEEGPIGDERKGDAVPVVSSCTRLLRACSIFLAILHPLVRRQECSAAFVKSMLTCYLGHSGMVYSASEGTERTCEKAAREQRQARRRVARDACQH